MSDAPPVDARRVEALLARYPRGDPGSLVNVLHDVQAEWRYLPEPALRQVAQHLGVSRAQLYGVATFYQGFHLEPRGAHTCTVCTGTACHVRGAPRLLDQLERDTGLAAGDTAADLSLTVEEVGCVGACALGPVVILDGEYQAHVTADRLSRAVGRLVGGAGGEAPAPGAELPPPGAESPPPGAEPEPDGRARRTTRLDDPVALARYREALRAAKDSPSAAVAVCVGTGCRANGALAVYEALRAELEARGAARRVEPRATGCLGLCQGGPLLELLPEGIVYQHVHVDDVPEVVERTVLGGELVERLLWADLETGLQGRSQQDIPFYRGQQRVLLGDNGRLDPASIDAYIALGGYSALVRALELGPEAVLDEVKRSGLRGRGGAGFPTGRKWEACRKAAGDLKYVVCNADEGDPGAFMDDALLEGNPHSVLEGMIIGAFVIGAREGHVYVRQEYPVAVERVTRAIAQARELGLLGEAILGSDFGFDVQVSRGGGAFVCGEASAMMASLEGRRGVPRRRLIHLSERGLRGRPTNLNNVETWANVPRIVLRGADWYSSIGTEGSTGTKIFSLVGKVENTGLVEVPMGTTLREIVFGAGGGVPGGKAFKAVQTGGPSGGCLPAAKLDLPVDFDTLSAEGSMMGSGGMIVMDEDTCMVDVARYFLRFLASESCGNCTSCREGVARLHELLIDITEGRGTRASLDLIEELADTVRATSLCALGTSAVNPVLSTLRHFQGEYVAHVDEKRCPAGVCKALITFTIDPDRCNGCTLCAVRCPQQAVAGERRGPHAIEQELCVKCGVCRDVCRHDAVVVQ